MAEVLLALAMSLAVAPVAMRLLARPPRRVDHALIARLEAELLDGGTTSTSVWAVDPGRPSDSIAQPKPTLGEMFVYAQEQVRFIPPQLDRLQAIWDDGHELDRRNG